MIWDEMIWDEMIGDETVPDETDWGRNGKGRNGWGTKRPDSLGQAVQTQLVRQTNKTKLYQDVNASLYSNVYDVEMLL